MNHLHSSLLCFAHGHEHAWEAICVDLDIAVQGTSFSDVKTLLDDAVSDYIEMVMQETAEVRDALLNRRAPWYVRTWLTLKLVGFNIFRGRGQEAHASFPVLCPS